MEETSNQIEGISSLCRAIMPTALHQQQQQLNVQTCKTQMASGTYIQASHKHFPAQHTLRSSVLLGQHLSSKCHRVWLSKP